MSEATQDYDIPAWSLSDRLRKSLEYRDLEVEQMAQWLEVHPNTIRNWIAGRTRPRPSDLKQWALLSRIPYRWLTYGDPPFGGGDTSAPAGGLEPQSAGLEKDPRPFGAAEKLAMRKLLPQRLASVPRSVTCS